MKHRYLCIAVAVASLAVGPLGHAEEVTKIVFIAGSPSHGPGEHEHRAGCLLLAKCLNENVPNVEAVVHSYGWPEDESIFDGAKSVVMYCDGGGGHMANPHLDTVNSLVAKGVGVVCLHYGVETLAGKEGTAFLDWIGGYFEANWSVNPHWMASFPSLPVHPITRGLASIEMQDEWYYHMRFREDMEGVVPILTALPPDSTLSRPDGPHSGNPEVRAAVARGEKQHMAWAYEGLNKHRGFGFTGGHFHRNWQDDAFRKLVLNAICWTAHVDVPEQGVQSPTPTAEEMAANQDDKKKRN